VGVEIAAMLKNWIFIILLGSFLTACHGRPWNDPYPASDAIANIYYASFSQQPKTLDPAKSYSNDESLFIAQIDEPPLQYHYLKRPYTLTPLTATAMPQIIYLNAKNKTLPANTSSKNIAYTVYKIQIKPGIYYQPHPAFAHQSNNNVTNKYRLSDFTQTGTRELTAEDYVYEIKRLADPRVQSPIYGLLKEYIVGFSEFNKQLQQIPPGFIDLRKIPLAGVQAQDKYNFTIKIKGLYPQFIYWLAMPFFSPVPWEADQFYSQPSMRAHNITLDWYPVGTGPYMLIENNPNRQMVLARNPNFHGERYPREGEPQDQALLKMAGKPLPFIDKFVFTLEKESIPRWNKFLQGYYDQSAISSDNFDQVVQLDSNGKPTVAPRLKEQGVRLRTSVALEDFYFGFNMLDPVVGGYSERARKLRQALAIAVDFKEFIAIFLNGRGIPAQGPLPPGIFGYQAKEQVEPKSIEDAKRLLTEAGYPNGHDPKTAAPLLLNFDVYSGGTADDRAMFAWLRKQFAQLGIQLQIRDTQYNRFQEKIRTGQAQIFYWAWHADYPDPENFLFLLYGPNGVVKYGGPNEANYQNTEFDALYNQMRNLPNGAERQAVIDRMVNIVQRDTPWLWGFHPENFVLSQAWMGLSKPNDMANNTLKYIYLDPKLRAQQRRAWNQPIVWPLLLGLLLIILILLPLFISYWHKQHQPSKK
jgi:oligopeptide transport system substrate-binding protein